jgi:hypothetical protein
MKAAMQKAKPKMLLADLRLLIAEARQDVVRDLNCELRRNVGRPLEIRSVAPSLARGYDGD